MMSRYTRTDRQVGEHFELQKQALLIECSCGFKDAPEPKWHDTDCTYRVFWTAFNGQVHMTKSQLKQAIKLRECKRMVIRECAFSEWDIAIFKSKGWL